MNNKHLLEKLNLYIEDLQNYQKDINNIKKAINKESDANVKVLMNLALDCCKSGEFLPPRNPLSLEKALIQIFSECCDKDEELDLSNPKEYFEFICSEIANALYKASNHYYLEKQGGIITPGMQNAYTNCMNYFDRVADRFLNLQRKKWKLDGKVANGAIYYS